MIDSQVVVTVAKEAHSFIDAATVAILSIVAIATYIIGYFRGKITTTKKEDTKK